jgi:hypothetical protein
MLSIQAVLTSRSMRFSGSFVNYLSRRLKTVSEITRFYGGRANIGTLSIKTVEHK